jgi:hypothetical protein
MEDRVRQLCRFLLLLPALTLVFGGCSDDFFSGLPGLRQILVGRGTAYGVRWLDSVARGIEAVASVTGEIGTLPEGVAYDPDTGAFSVDIDTTRNGVQDSTLSGFLTSGDDISDGIGAGERATFDWVASGEITGSGTIRLLGLGPDQYAATGGAFLADGTEFEFEVRNIDLVLDDSDYPLDGTIDYETYATGLTIDPYDEEITIEPAEMDGILEFFGTERATGSGEFDGEDLQFDVKLDTFQVIFTL